MVMEIFNESDIFINSVSCVNCFCGSEPLHRKRVNLEQNMNFEFGCVL